MWVCSHPGSRGVRLPGCFGGHKLRAWKPHPAGARGHRQEAPQCLGDLLPQHFCHTRKYWGEELEGYLESCREDSRHFRHAGAWPRGECREPPGAHPGEYKRGRLPSFRARVRWKKDKARERGVKCSVPGCFLQDLSDSSFDYTKNFKKKREELTKSLFVLYNSSIFQNKLPENMEVTWNKKMTKTSGYCVTGQRKGTDGQRYARIELSDKVCDSAERLRDTLVHEMCHAATWFINGVRDGHGTLWKLYAKKSTLVHPELPMVTRCHTYEINYKYHYQCTRCKHMIGRHSKSLDTQRFVCAFCQGTLILMNPSNKKQSANEGKLTPFAAFVKENYKSAKNELSGIDRCIAIKWPLHYEAILSSGRKATLVCMIWGLSMALTTVALFLSVNSITCNFTVKRCLPILFSRRFLESDAYFGFKKILTAMLFLGSYTCIFLCFVILCWDIRIFLKTKQVWVTITLQGLQLIFYSVPVFMRYFLTQYIENKYKAELAIEAVFDLGLSLIPLVYGYRSAELHILMCQLCQLLPLSKNQIQPRV
ncbi:ACRC protein, partial [Polypterus senegalus]